MNKFSVKVASFCVNVFGGISNSTMYSDDKDDILIFG